MTLNIGVIIGSSRPGRNGAKVADWFKQITDQYKDAEFQFIDLQEENLPFFDESAPPSMGKYQNAHTKAWAAKIAPHDGFVIITPEYNRGPAAVLKNALDFINKEWNDKPVAFIGYGANGGVRAIEQLRSNAIELRMAPIRDHVALTIFSYFDDQGNMNIPDAMQDAAKTMLDSLVKWVRAFKDLRNNEKGV